MTIRKITSMTMFVSFIMLILNSVILYIVPEGRVAYWADWHMLGLTKSEWGNQHINFGFLFLLAGLVHLFYNWKPIMAYMKNKAKEFKMFTGAMNVALLISAVVAVGTYYEVPPLSTVLKIGGGFKDRAAAKYGEPPYGHAELSSLAMLTKKEGLDLQQSLVLLKEAGMRVEGEKDTVVAIAKKNKMTPQQIFEIIKPAGMKKTSGEGQSEQSSAVKFPDSPKPGWGKMTLKAACEQYHLSLPTILTGLTTTGVAAEGDMSIKDIAAKNDKQPMEIFEILASLAEQQ